MSSNPVFRLQPFDPSSALMGGFQQGMDLRDLIEGRKKKADFERTFKGLAQLGDITTPEGQQQLVRDLSQMGYGQEAMSLMSQLPQQPKAAPPEWRRAGEGPIFNSGTGDFRQQPAAPPMPQAQAPQGPSGVPGWAAPPGAPGASPSGPMPDSMPTGAQLNKMKFDETKRMNDARIAAMNRPRPGPAARSIKPGAVENALGGLADGDTAVDGLAPIPGVAITKKSIEKVKMATEHVRNLKQQMADYRAAYAEHGTEAVGANATTLQAMATGLKLNLKELQNLGVLNGPDLMLMNQQVPDAGGPMAKGRSLFNPILGDPITSKLDQLDKFVTTKYQAALSSNGFREAGKAPAGPSKPKSDPLGLFK